MKYSGSIPRWLLPVAWCVSLVLAFTGWFAAGNTPRDGWSLVSIAAGLAPMPGSGDRAYFIAGYGGGGYAPIETDTDLTHGWVLVRRERVGLFSPWHETENLRIAAVSGTQARWQSGSDDPTWHQALRSARGWYAQRGTAWHRRVVDAIDDELRGGYPVRRVRMGALGLEVVFVGAHVVVLLPVLLIFQNRIGGHGAVGHEHAPTAYTGA